MFPKFLASADDHQFQIQKLLSPAPKFMVFFLSVSLMQSVPAYAADEEENPLSLKIETGVEYDDNITIDSSDSNSRQGDSAFLLRANLGFDLSKSKTFKAKAHYSFSQSLHQDLTDFDLQIHGASLNISTKLKDVTVGANYRYSFIKLGAEGFLDIHSIKPNIAFLASKKVYLTADYEYQKQSFKQDFLTSRNSDRHSVASKAFFLLGKGKNITTGYKISRHTTPLPELSYWAHTADLGTKLPVTLGSLDSTFRARYRYRQKDYSGVHPTIGAERADRRHSFRASLEMPLFSKIEGKLQYEFIDSNSNLAVVDYQSHIIGFTLAWTL